MKSRNILIYGSVLIISVILLQLYQGCSSSRIKAEYRTDTLYTNPSGAGDLIEFRFLRGSEHNHPLMALWITDTSGKYIQTLYIAQSIAKGVFEHGDASSGKWQPGPIRRPAALPVWAYSRGVKESDGLYLPMQNTPVPDAYTGATPQAHFVIFARTDSLLPDLFYVYFEINQSWDWNNYWTNNKYPDDEEYKTSCQPALVYRTLLNRNNAGKFQKLELIGHSHYSGKNGLIYSDLGNITTAKAIAESITIKVVK